MAWRLLRASTFFTVARTFFSRSSAVRNPQSHLRGPRVLSWLSRRSPSHLALRPDPHRLFAPLLEFPCYSSSKPRAADRNEFRRQPATRVSASSRTPDKPTNLAANLAEEPIEGQRHTTRSSAAERGTKAALEVKEIRCHSAREPSNKQEMSQKQMKTVESASTSAPLDPPQRSSDRGTVSSAWYYVLGASIVTAGLFAYWRARTKAKAPDAPVKQAVKDSAQSAQESSGKGVTALQGAMEGAQTWVSEGAKGLPSMEDAKKMLYLDQPLFNMPDFHLPDLTSMAGSVFGKEMAEALQTVAKSMQEQVRGLGPWGIAELTVGLYAIGKAHAKFNVQDMVGKVERASKEQLEGWLKDLEMVDATYYMEEGKEDPAAWVQEELRTRGVWERGRVVKAAIESEVLKPAHFIAISDAHKSIIVSVRGTSSPSDMFTDLAGSCEGLSEDEYVHCGMHQAATWLLELERDNLIKMLKEHKGYQLRLLGHSLGAGTAAIAALKLREDPGVPEKDKITALCIAPPAIMSRNLADNCSFITSIVLQDDIVPRASLGSLEDLRTEVLLTDWAKMLDLNLQDPRLQAIQKYVTASLQSMKPTVQEVEQWLKHAGTVDEAIRQFGPQESLESIEGKPDKEVAGLSTAEQAAELLKRWGIEGESGETKATEEKDESIGKKREDMEERKREALVVEAERLFAPGTLYHVLRFKPAEQKSNESMGVKEGVAEEQSVEAEEDEKEELTKQTMLEQASYEVWKGKPGEKFSRIVLSDTMFDDHFSENYRTALQRAIRAVQ